MSDRLDSVSGLVIEVGQAPVLIWANSFQDYSSHNLEGEL